MGLKSNVIEEKTYEKVAYSLNETSQMIGLSYLTLYHLYHQGKLPGSFRIGRSIMVSSATLQAMKEGIYNCEGDS